MFSKKNIIIFFRYLWLMLALSLVLYVISNNIITERELIYNLDFSQNIRQDVRGWYPESRVKYIEKNNELFVIGEPIYMQIYVPADFDSLSINGTIDFSDEELKLGIKQKDSSWFWQNVVDKDVNLEFPLQEASHEANKIEIILSIPDHSDLSSIYLKNNWQLTFTR